jgi:hypothetical protein
MNKKSKSKPRKYTRAILGDIFEVEVEGGYAYGQYINYHKWPPVYGYLVRVFVGIYKTPISDVSSLDGQPDQFISFYALSLKDVKLIGSLPIPDELKEFPLFKSLHLPPCGKHIFRWYINKLSNMKSKDVLALEWEQKLPDEYMNAPYLGLINHPMLVTYIENKWSPLLAPYINDEGKYVDIDEYLANVKPNSE